MQKGAILDLEAVEPKMARMMETAQAAAKALAVDPMTFTAGGSQGRPPFYPMT